MHFEGEFSVPGRPDDVIRRFADVERMARCMPGAVIEGRDEEGNYLGGDAGRVRAEEDQVQGPRRVETDFAAQTGSLHGRGAADMRAARIEVTHRLRVARRSGGGRPTRSVTLTSDAELGGVLADFARTGGVPFANALMQDFSRRVAEEFASDAPAPQQVSDRQCGAGAALRRTGCCGR